MSRRTQLKHKKRIVYINTKIQGEPAEWLLEWKRRGIVTTTTDAIVQAFRAFHEKLMEQDMKQAQLKRLEEEEIFG